jgi:sacsin
MKSILGYRHPADCIIRDSEWAVASCISNLSFLDVQFYGEDILQYTPELEFLCVIVGLKKNYELVINNFEFSSSAITSQATILILKCIRYVNRSEDFIRKLKDLKWLKTNMGFRAPNETFFLDPEWECRLKVFDGTPVIDYGFYGSEINSYKEELKKIGLVMRFEEASKAITQIFKEMVSNSSLTKASVLALLGSYRQLRTHYPPPDELFNCMCSEKWLHTSLGFRSPSEAVVFYDTWQTLSPSKLTIDDADSCHGLGQEIHGYKDELNKLGVTVEAKNGARFVILGLSIPSDPSIMSEVTVVSLLACIQSYFKCAASPPKGFQEKICMKWLNDIHGLPIS